ncbi:MAG: hypothetical protein KAW02_05630 [candidate division Zixibacteria bacterium]|nr:hypothetical protein [candidate division Zixibacteria bacterium]
MQPKDVAEKITIILDAKPKSLTTFYPAKDGKRPSGAKSGFSNEHVELLLQLESRIHVPQSKELFWQLMGINFASCVPKIAGASPMLAKAIIKAASQTRKHCDCAFMVYLRSGRINKALEGFSERIKDYSSVNETNNQIIFCIFQVLLMEPHLFSDVHLKAIESIMGRYQSCISDTSSWQEKKTRKMQVPAEQVPDAVSKLFGLTFAGTLKEQIPTDLPSTDLISRSKDLLSKLCERLRQVKFQRLKEELKGVSTEINQDKNQLVRKYKDLTLNTMLVEALENIDAEIEESGSPFNRSKSIAFIRNVYEESVRQVAIVIRYNTKRPVSKWTDRGKFGEAVTYLKEVGFISTKEEKWLAGFYGLISDTGSHRLSSERFEVRLARNILVETCYYLTDKIDKFLAEVQETKQQGR